ncbi:hypothetical protein AB4Y45_32300 [Paraburkholderia sp. EG287A]|uniref:hypothetical protein n=1 Tax=Paraburkholderia sp. EG287A TaxID=3237012 RepID=UPI0034D29443
MRPTEIQCEQLLNLDGWAKSWAREREDENPGYAVVRRLKPFLEYLVSQGLDFTTLRRHKNSLYLLGGRVFDDMTRHEEGAPADADEALDRLLPLDSGPFLLDGLEAERRNLDTTARQLYRFRQRLRYGDTDWA